MTRGGYRASKSSCRSKSKIANPVNKPSVPTTATEQGGTSSIPSTMPTGQALLPSIIPVVQTSAQRSNPTIPVTSPVTTNQSSPIGQDMPTQSNPTGEGTSNQTNIIGESNSSNSHARTLVFLTSSGSEVDPNGINWKGVSNEVRDGYFGEFKQNFYWDSSTSDIAVKKQLLKKAAKCYSGFISNIKRGKKKKPKCINEHVWESWMELWRSDECVKKSETNANNRRGGCEVAAGTHTGGSITIGEHRKKLAIKLGRDPTPSELHLHVHTHCHDGKSFVDECSRLVHENYEQILQEKTQSQSEIDQSEAYYQAAGGIKKSRVYGLGSEARSYFQTKLCGSNASSSSSVPPLVSQSAPTNLDEFVKQLLPALTNYFLPVVIECVDRGQEVVTPTVPDPPPTTNGDETDP